MLIGRRKLADRKGVPMMVVDNNGQFYEMPYGQPAQQQPDNTGTCRQKHSRADWVLNFLALAGLIFCQVGSNFVGF